MLYYTAYSGYFEVDIGFELLCLLFVYSQHGRNFCCVLESFCKVESYDIVFLCSYEFLLYGNHGNQIDCQRCSNFYAIFFYTAVFVQFLYFSIDQVCFFYCFR